MIIKTSFKTLTLLLAADVTFTSGSNLRRRRAALFGHHDGNEAPLAAAQNQLRGSSAADAPPAIAVEEGQTAAAAAAEEAAAAALSPDEPTPVEEESSGDPDVEEDAGGSGDAYADEEASAPSSPQAGALSSNKPEYEDDESVSIHFSLDSSDISGYKIGLFMRHADPQEGTLAPIASLPLSGPRGSVTFSRDTMGMMNWPLDIFEWGTGFDAYVLDQHGVEVVGPVEFNIMSDY